jgi:hypothetical protein
MRTIKVWELMQLLSYQPLHDEVAVEGFEGDEPCVGISNAGGRVVIRIAHGEWERPVTTLEGVWTHHPTTLVWERRSHETV